MADCRSLEYCFSNIIDFIRLKLESKEIFTLTRISQMFSSTIKSIANFSDQIRNNCENKIKELEDALNTSFINNRAEVSALKEDILTKDKQIEEFDASTKLTQEEKAAIQFFEDNYIQSDSLAQIISDNHIKTMNSEDEISKQILTDLTKVTESGVTEILNRFQESISQSLGESLFGDYIILSKKSDKKEVPYSELESEINKKIKSVQI